MANTVNKIDSSGNYYVGGQIDEVSASIFSSSTIGVISYSIAANVATASVNGVTIIGNPGAGGTFSGGAGGAYQITGGSVGTAVVITGGVNGGAGFGTGGFGGDGTGGGAIGGGVSTSRGGKAEAIDVSGLFAAATEAGYDATLFGDSGYGGVNYTRAPTAGEFPGGGGGGAAYIGGFTTPGPGGGAAIVIRKRVNGVFSTTVISSGSGTVTLPAGCSFLKIWVIGAGGYGGYPPGGANSAAGGGGGGVAYLEFSDATANTYWSSLPSSGVLISKQYSNGTFQVLGRLDEVSAQYFSNLTLSYSFPTNDATATLFGVTVTGLNGTTSSSVSSPGGSYSIASSNPYSITGGVNGGNGSDTWSSGGLSYGGGGGGIGGHYPGNTTAGATGYDISGLWEAATLAGYAGDGTFGKGGGGSLQASGAGTFPGGGGGGYGGGYAAGAPGAAGVIILYQVGTTRYATAITSAAGDGTFSFPVGTNYIKVWAIGRGGGGSSGQFNIVGPGGGAGGCAYADFQITDYSLSNTYGGAPPSTGTTTNYATKFNGTSQYLTIPSTFNFSFGTGDFTVEAFLFTPAPPGGGATFDKTVFGGFSASSPSFHCFLTNDTNAPAFYDGTSTYTSVYNVPTNAWRHVAWVRKNNQLSIYVDGLLGVTQESYTKNFSSVGTHYIGRADTTATRYYSGWIADLRIVKSAVYTNIYTPPTISFPRPTVALETIPSTGLLAFQSADPTIDSTGFLNLTNVGTTSDRIQSSFNKNYFGGSSHLSLPISSDWIMTGNFTIECWFYATSLPAAYKPLIDLWNVTSSGNFKLGISSTNFPAFYYDSANLITSSTSIVANTWYHISAVRSGSTITMY
jgi:hypothetical protein